MGAMEGSSKEVTLTLALVLALCLLVPIMPNAAASPANATSVSSQPNVQYSPTAQFSNGTVFDDQSSVVSVDPGVQDFAIGDLNHDGLSDVAVMTYAFTAGARTVPSPTFL
ncbi:MAG: hypothetical protein ABR879_07060 [Methanomassiliicoccales archaeon]